MTTVNEHTGKFIRTRAATKEYRDNYAIIEENRKKKKAGKPKTEPPALLRDQAI